MELQEDLPLDKRQRFCILMEAGCLVVRISLQAAMDAVDMPSCFLATGIVMCHSSWLQSSDFPQEVQTTIQDFSDEDKFFLAKMDESLHSLKDSKVTLRSLRIYNQSSHCKQQ